MATKAITANLSGGRAYQRHMESIESQLGRGAHVRVGFLSSATYPGTQKADDEAGRKITGKNANARRQRNLSARQTAAYGGGDLHVAQVAFWNEFGTKRSPARPFFRSMVERKSPRWGVLLGTNLRKTHYNATDALALTGEVIVGQLKQSINDWSSPANADYTVSKKGFNKPLIDTAVMVRSPDFQVMDGLEAQDE